jgi:hypothetical protein
VKHVEHAFEPRGAKGHRLAIVSVVVVRVVRVLPAAAAAAAAAAAITVAVAAVIVHAFHRHLPQLGEARRIVAEDVVEIRATEHLQLDARGGAHGGAAHTTGEQTERWGGSHGEVWSETQSHIRGVGAVSNMELRRLFFTFYREIW